MKFLMELKKVADSFNEAMETISQIREGNGAKKISGNVMKYQSNKTVKKLFK